jgi:beta-lactamase superfamily II metal-dependent hydrolase
MITIKIFPASYGDCILVSINEQERCFNILIDGGLAKTYEKTLKKELGIISQKNQHLDLLINTHIDADHINGLISLIKENNEKKYINIKEIWFNGLEQIATQYPQNITDIPIQDDVLIINELNSKGYEDEFQKTEEIGPTEGVSFSGLIAYGEYCHNAISSGKAITDCLGKIEISKNIKIRIINPNIETLGKLEIEWFEELAKMGFQFSISKSMQLVSSFEFIVSRLKKYYESYRQEISSIESLESFLSDLEKIDTSVVNGSSISFVIEAYDKKFLFLGDAIIREKGECNIINNLINYYGEGALFDVIKLPHHGSNYNISKDFISLFKAKEYIVSSNSAKFGHPDMDVIANIILENRNEEKIITFNYPVNHVKILDNIYWKKKYNYTLIVGNGDSFLERGY